jgi:uncharacterized short protein YbdD (DUF466 family)
MSSNRKSEATREGTEGNVEKYLSYSEAWSRIDKAREQGFYLEAVTIEESIICDRLISYLVEVGAIDRKSDLHEYPSFYGLIQKWRESTSGSVSQNNFSDLIGEVDDWRDQRNYLIHSMVKSHPGTPTDRIEDFLNEAQEAADKGKKLARAVDKWHEEEVK